MREKKYHLYLSDDEYAKVIVSLVHLRNDLIMQGRHTDAVDDVFCKIMIAKKKNMKIKYI